MRILTVHSDFIEFEPKRKAIKAAEEIEKKLNRVEECLVVLSSVESGDEEHFEEISEKAVAEVESVSEQVKTKNIVLYPWVHLSDKPSRPDVALRVLKNMEADLKKKGYTVTRAPFGWYKAFDLKCKGHPLSELSRTISIGEKDDEKKAEVSESQSLLDEQAAKHEFFIMDPDGTLTSVKDYNFTKHKNLGKFAKYETQKQRESDMPPPHADLMRKLSLVDYEPGSDAGNFRWYPKGWMMKYLIEELVKDLTIAYGAMPIESPIMYSYTHPAIEKYMNRFPARQYVLKSGTDNYFLRFAACFGQFLMSSDAHITYHNLPVKLFEMTHYSFRREQRGELAALRRLRTFTMPDMHTIAKDLPNAKKYFVEQYRLSMVNLDAFELDYESAFRVQKDFFEENKDWYIAMVKERKRPALIELFDKRFAYYITKFEFNFVDNQDKAAALSTVQIDVENAERFDISFVDKNNEKQRPYLLHTSISGAIERIVYAILEKAYTEQIQGKKPMFPIWLSPVQVRLLPVNEDFVSHCKKLAEKLTKQKIRVDIDDRSERIGKKIRKAEQEWIPYVIVIGEKELASNKFNVRVRKDQEEKLFTEKTLIKRINDETKDLPYVPLTLPMLVTLQPLFSQLN
ncbi:MAG: threonine--tRNA ligase [Candidatus Heimdallarchaeota archaeon]|nr:threonine--tRNA ligase [Candidatus Heimdallarchaeota archaeon]MBY8993454.1 threonine--tRNA ligase [Candidatus Heimdallarchaeota archaeon]